MIAYILVFFSLLFASSGMISFKKAALKTEVSFDIERLINTAASPQMALSAVLIMMSAVAYILALSTLDMSIAFSFTSLNYVFILIGANIFLKESVNRFHIIGIASIILGVILFNTF